MKREPAIATTPQSRSVQKQRTITRTRMTDWQPTGQDLFKELQSQLQAQRLRQSQMATYTEAFLGCLIDRHDLDRCLSADQIMEGIPRRILTTIQRGQTPSVDDLQQLSVEAQQLLIRELVWISGHGAIRWYREQGLSDQGTQWEPRDDLTPVEWTVSYVRAALALLLSSDPSDELLALIMPDHGDSDQQIRRNRTIYLELQAAILKRHQEDVHYRNI